MPLGQCGLQGTYKKLVKVNKGKGKDKGKYIYIARFL